MLKIVVSILMLSFSNYVLSGSATGKVSSVLVSDNTLSVLFTLDTEIEDTPRCNERKKFSILLRKPGGAAAYTAILEAKKEGYEVHVEGLNSCSNDWKSEDLKSIEMY